MDEKTMRFWFILCVVLLCIILALGIYTFVKNFIFQKSFQQGKVKLSSGIDVEIDTNEKTAYFLVSNVTFSGINIKSMGFICDSKNYDYINIYRRQKEMKSDEKVFVPARESIKMVLDYEELLSRFNAKKVIKIKQYVTDNVGRTTTKVVKAIRKVIIEDTKPLYKAVDEKQKADYNALSKEEKMEYKKAEAEKKEKERLEKIERLNKIKNKKNEEVVVTNIKEDVTVESNEPVVDNMESNGNVENDEVVIESKDEFQSDDQLIEEEKSSEDVEVVEEEAESSDEFETVEETEEDK